MAKSRLSPLKRQLSVVVPLDIVARLDAIAKHEGRPRGAVAAELLEDALTAREHLTGAVQGLLFTKQGTVGEMRKRLEATVYKAMSKTLGELLDEGRKGRKR